MIPNIPDDVTELDMINLVLADLGSVVRRTRANTLSEVDFEALMARSRQRMKWLRDQTIAEEQVLELTDAGRALVDRSAIAKRRGVLGLFDRLPGLMTGRELVAGPYDACPDRMRTVGRFGVIEGGAS